MSKPAGVPAPNPAAPKSPSITCTWRVGDAAIVRPRVTSADRRTPDRSVLRGQGKALGDGGDEGRAHRPRGGRSLTGGQRSHGPDTLSEVRPTRLPCSGRGADERPDDSGQPRALLAGAAWDGTAEANGVGCGNPGSPAHVHGPPEKPGSRSVFDLFPPQSHEAQPSG